MARKLGWHPEDIKAGLRKKYGPLGKLSESWGFHGNSITNVLRSPLSSKKVELLVAEALGVPAHEIWPARWAADGTSLHRSIEFDPIGRMPGSNSQKSEAA